MGTDGATGALEVKALAMEEVMVEASEGKALAMEVVLDMVGAVSKVDSAVVLATTEDLDMREVLEDTDQTEDQSLRFQLEKNKY